MIFGTLSFLLTICFWQGMASAATIPRWTLLVVAVPAILWFARDRHFTAVHLAGTLFLAWATVSLTWAMNLPDAQDALIKWFLLAGVFGLGLRAPSLKPVFIGMALGLIPSAVVSFIQLYDPVIVTSQSGMFTGLFFNQNTYAETSALVLVGLVGYRLWWLAPVCFPPLLFTSSRAAWVIVAAAALVWMWQYSRRITLIVALGIVLIVGITPFITFGFENGFKTASTIERWNLYRDTIDGLTFWGHGVGSFQTAYPFGASRMDLFQRRPENAHNDYLELVYELGPGALFGFAVLALCLFRPYASGPARFVLFGFAADALVAFPSHLACSAYLAALCIGHLSRFRPPLCDELAHGRMVLQYWLSRFLAGRKPLPLAESWPHLSL